MSSSVFSVGSSVVNPFALRNLHDLEEESSFRRNLMDTGSDPVLSEMSHSDRIDYLRYSNQLDALSEAKAFNKTAKVEVQKTLVGVQGIEKNLKQIGTMLIELRGKEEAERQAKDAEKNAKRALQSPWWGPRLTKDAKEKALITHKRAVADLNTAQDKVQQLKNMVDTQVEHVKLRLKSVMNDARAGKVYGSENGPVSLKQQGYVINQWQSNSDKNGSSLLGSLKEVSDFFNKFKIQSGTNKGVAQKEIDDIEERVSTLKDKVLWNLSFDAATVEESIGKIQGEEKMLQSLLEGFNVGAEAKRAAWAESKERMKRFVYGLDHEMAWSRQMTQKMFQSLA